MRWSVFVSTKILKIVRAKAAQGDTNAKRFLDEIRRLQTKTKEKP